MTSLVNKYHPQSFDQVIGQDIVVRTLRNALADGQPLKASLLTGQVGVGKTTIARIMAKGLNCVNGPTGDPCQTCQQCIGITKGHHIDVRELTAVSLNSSNNMRSMLLQTLYPPWLGRFFVVVIEDCDLLSGTSSSVLLSTLDKPPSHVVFILTSTNVGKVHDGVRSRCARCVLRPIKPSLIVSHLEWIAEAEQATVSRVILNQIAHFCGGSARDAVWILQQCIAYGDDLNEKVVQEIMGV